MRHPHVVLLVQNEAGYLNLTKLLSAAYLEVEAGDWSHVKAAKLFAHNDGLILLTGGPGGLINQFLLDGQRDQADAALDQLAQAFPDRLYVELQRHGLPEERACEDATPYNSRASGSIFCRNDHAAEANSSESGRPETTSRQVLRD